MKNHGYNRHKTIFKQKSRKSALYTFMKLLNYGKNSNSIKHTDL